MSRVIPFDLGQQRTVLIEVEDTPVIPGRVGDPSRGRGSARRGVLAEQAKQKLDEALAQVRPAAELVMAKLEGLARPPAEITIEFGIKITAEAGAVIAKAATESNFQVKLKWQRQPAATGGSGE